MSVVRTFTVKELYILIDESKKCNCLSMIQAAALIKIPDCIRKSFL